RPDAGRPPRSRPAAQTRSAWRLSWAEESTEARRPGGNAVPGATRGPGHGATGGLRLLWTNTPRLSPCQPARRPGPPVSATGVGALQLALETRDALSRRFLGTCGVIENLDGNPAVITRCDQRPQNRAEVHIAHARPPEVHVLRVKVPRTRRVAA